MATTISTIIATCRTRMLETTAGFWTDAELLGHAQNGVTDLWGAILDLHQEHFLTIDETTMSLATSGTSLSGVPADVFRIHTIEPRDLTETNAARGITFAPRDFNHPDFVGARGMAAQSPSNQTVYFAIVGAGAPVAAPTIRVAPLLTLSTSLLLRVAYVPTITLSSASVANPIPGSSDGALENWIMAHALGKQSGGQLVPEPGFLMLYATDKKNLLTRLTPRQTVEPDYAEAFMEEYW
jgi:hypothetical protein